jgi:hypothetical protein
LAGQLSVYKQASRNCETANLQTQIALLCAQNLARVDDSEVGLIEVVSAEAFLGVGSALKGLFLRICC